MVKDAVFFISYGVTLVWMVWLSANQVADAIISSSPRVKAGSLNASLFKLISRSVGVVAVLVLVFQILNEVGVPVYGLVTGAGIGGIAIALAAKSTLENFMGALNLFADRPVSIGDLCRYNEESLPGWRPVGRVESIGLRSTNKLLLLGVSGGNVGGRDAEASLHGCIHGIFRKIYPVAVTIP
jgi:MscS family membrane protein